MDTPEALEKFAGYKMIYDLLYHYTEWAIDDMNDNLTVEEQNSAINATVREFFTEKTDEITTLLSSLKIEYS